MLSALLSMYVISLISMSIKIDLLNSSVIAEELFLLTKKRKLRFYGNKLRENLKKKILINVYQIKTC